MSDKYQGIGPENEKLAESLASAFRKEREKSAIGKMVGDKVAATDFANPGGRNFVLWPLMIVIVFGIFSLTTYTVYKFAAEDDRAADTELTETAKPAQTDIKDEGSSNAASVTQSVNEANSSIADNEAETADVSAPASKGSTRAINKHAEEIAETRTYETKVNTKVDVSGYTAKELDVALGMVINLIGLEYSEKMENGTKSFTTKQKTGFLPSKNKAVDFKIIFAYDTPKPGELKISLVYTDSGYDGDYSNLPNVENMFYNALKDGLSKAL